jgi:hypothetical protein
MERNPKYPNIYLNCITLNQNQSQLCIEGLLRALEDFCWNGNSLHTGECNVSQIEVKILGTNLPYSYL